MEDWYQDILSLRAKKIIRTAQENNLDFLSFMKEAARSGVSSDPDVLNYARLLKGQEQRQRSAQTQQQITGAVGRAMQAPTSETELGQMRETMTPEQYGETLKADTSRYLGSAPRTEEQFMGAMGRQTLSPETTYEDVQANPAFRFAQGELGSEADDLAKARLKVQQDAEARKAKQINEKNRLGDIRLKLQQNELDFKRYKLGVGTENKWLDRADDVEKRFQDTTQDLIELEGREKKLKKIISSGQDEEGNILIQEEMDNAKNQLAEVETMLLKGEAQKKALSERVKQLTSEAYSQGEKVRKQSPKAFQEPGAEKSPTGPAPSKSLSETVQERRARLKY